MSAEQTEIPDEESERSWGERIADVAEVWRALARTRLAIFREELSEKLAFVLKGAVSIAIAAFLAAGALLLLAAFLAVLLAQVLGNVALGILATFLLFGIGAGVAAIMGWKALTRVRPLEFPVARDELSRDWEAVRVALSPDVASPGGDPGPYDQPVPTGQGPGAPKKTEALEDMEERYRAGAE
ncbi:MAG: phage holin family protein [Acidobacteriota bacterium]